MSGQVDRPKSGLIILLIEFLKLVMLMVGPNQTLQWKPKLTDQVIWGKIYYQKLISESIGYEPTLRYKRVDQPKLGSDVV